MNDRDHHDAALADLEEATASLTGVIETLNKAHTHLVDVPKRSSDPGKSHLSAYVAGRISVSTMNVADIREQIERTTAHIKNIRDHGVLNK